MRDRKTIFDKYMEEYVKLPIVDKYNQIIEKQKRIIALLYYNASENGVDLEMLSNKELFDLTKENPTNDDYVEAIMVYSQNIEELLSQILSNNL